MKLVVATKNADKLKEMQRILIPLGIEAISENELDCQLPDVLEDGATFEENALIKARSATRATGMPAVADDSGLCVDALGGQPGIYTARYAGEPSNSQKNNEKLLYEMRNVAKEDRTARFVSAVACTFPDGREFCVRGECEGHIAFELSGDGGFGYDPLFVCELGCFAEITPKQKDSVSHRGKAMEIFSEEIKKYI